MIELPGSELLSIYDEMLFVTATDTVSLPDSGFSSPMEVLVLATGADLTPDSVQLVTKMMEACQLKPEAYRIQEASPARVFELKSRYQPRYIILFGLEPETDSVRISAVRYRPFPFAGIQMILADSLSQIGASPEKKRELWKQGLMPMFNLV